MSEKALLELKRVQAANRLYDYIASYIANSPIPQESQSPLLSDINKLRIMARNPHEVTCESLDKLY